MEDWLRSPAALPTFPASSHKNRLMASWLPFCARCCARNKQQPTRPVPTTPPCNCAQDAARRALEQMFKGKGDSLAAFDPDSTGGGPGGGKRTGGGGGGGGSGWSMPDWRGWFSGFWGRFGELGKALQAILAFAAVMLAVCYLGDVISAVTGALTLVMRWVLRLDARRGPVGNPRLAAAPAGASAPGLDSGLGSFERSVIGKYGPSQAAPVLEEEDLE